MKAIRNLYSELGVEAYYKAQGKDYRNPHLREIRNLLIQNDGRLDYKNVLDFCCGSGEVSEVLAELGYTASIGCDPYTYEAYERTLGKPCWRYTFEDVIRGQLEGDFSCVLCSFAMHLCPEKQLYPLVYQLFQVAPIVVIITPHKRPVLEELGGVELFFEDFTLTAKGKKVRLKAYKMGY